METRAWAPIIVLLIVIVGAFGFHYLDKVDKANADYQNAKHITQQAHEGPRGRHEMMEVRRKIASQHDAIQQRIRTAETRLAAQEKAMEEADKKQRTIEGDLKYWREAMPSIRQKVWQAAAGNKIGDVALLSGKTLKNVEIRRVEETAVSLSHSDGIGTVGLDELPRDLVAKFDLGDMSLVRQFEQLNESLMVKPQNTITDESAAKMPRAGEPVVDEAKLKALKIKEADMLSKISAAKQAKASWDRQVFRIYEQINDSKNRGVPTTRLRDEYQKVQAQASASAAVVLGYEAELRKIKAALDILLLPNSGR